MRKSMMKSTKKDNGITLIALIITIIVLLILAGISISMLMGENGLITKANEAKIRTEKASEEEQVNLKVIGSYGRNGLLDQEELEDNLRSIPGVTVTKSNGEYIVTYPGGNSYKVDSNGNVTPVTPGRTNRRNRSRKQSRPQWNCRW